VATAAFFPLLINTVAGVQQIPPQHFEVARSYGASPLKQFQRVVAPGSLPYVLAGLRLGLNGALLLTIAVEIVSSGSGLGADIWLAWMTMRVENLYATLAVITLIGLVLNGGLNWLARRLLPWQADGAQNALNRSRRMAE
jgi:NitT/TauT family transport system permease protein